MKLFRLLRLEDQSIYFDHTSCMMASDYEKKVNELAGQTITTLGPGMLELFGWSPFGNLIVSFHVKPEFERILMDKVISQMQQDADGRWFFKEEMTEANQI